MAAVDLIIFGASGDLSARKLFPALFQLERLNLLQKDLRIAAVARTKQTLDEFLPVLKGKMSSYMGDDAPNEDEWASFTQRFSYVAVNFSELLKNRLAKILRRRSMLTRRFQGTLMKRRSIESTTIWVKKRSKICWFCDSRTVSSIANGTTPALITFRSR